MKLFIGLDVSLAKTAVCVINEHGKIVKEEQVARHGCEVGPQVAKRRGAKRAMVALARRIGTILHRMWTDARQVRLSLTPEPYS